MRIIATVLIGTKKRGFSLTYKEERPVNSGKKPGDSSGVVGRVISIRGESRSISDLQEVKPNFSSEGGEGYTAPKGSFGFLRSGLWGETRRTTETLLCGRRKDIHANKKWVIMRGGKNGGVGSLRDRRSHDNRGTN